MRRCRRALTVLVVLSGLVAAVGCQSMGRKPAMPVKADPSEERMKAQTANIQGLEGKLKQRDAQVADLTKALESEKARSAELQKDNDQLKAGRPKQVNLKDLEAEMGPDVKIIQRADGIALSFLGEVLFDSGKATLSKKGTATLQKTADVLRKRFADKNIVIEGHTDNVPIKKSSFASNWELSADRSLAVVHFLINKESFSPKKVAAVAYGDTQPVASNDSESGRKQNRRAVIVIKHAT